MVGKEPEEYRPRRAYVGPDAEPTDPGSKNPQRPHAESGPRQPVAAAADDDAPKPLYRDDVASRTARPAADDDETRLLPRTATGSRRPYDSNDIDDDDDEWERSSLGRRGKLALLIGAVAAVAVVGLAIGYAVLNLGQEPTTSPSPSLSTGPSTTSDTASPSPTPAPEPAGLSSSAMLTARDAAQIDGDRTWKVALTQQGVDEESPRAACLDGEPVEGQPSSQQTMIRLLSSSGKNAPGIFQQASVYATADEAAQAYAVTSKSLGGCIMNGAYIESGRVINGLGNQSVGLVLNVKDGSKTQFRSVVLNRTGRVINVVDVAQPDGPVPIDDVVAAVAAVTNRECKPAGGSCASKVDVKRGPPPLGGDVLGFLAAGDLPPAGDTNSLWVGDQPAAPRDDLAQSGCETSQWAEIDAEKRTARTYLQATGTPTFGLDEIILTTKATKDAEEVVMQVKKDLDDCETRKLTATVSKPEEITGTGAKGADISGWTATVSQESTDGTAEYRVGIVSTGSKVLALFLNVQKNLDVTDAEWDAVAVRAGERASQVK